MMTKRYASQDIGVYDPNLHDQQFKRWVEEDVDYLIKFYKKDGLAYTALVLGRSECSVVNKIKKLRKSGRMAKHGQ